MAKSHNKYAKAPWYNDDFIIRQTGTDAQIAIVTYDEGGNLHEDVFTAKRIVACVNACRNANDPEKLINDSVNALLENDELNENIDSLKSVLKNLINDVLFYSRERPLLVINEAKKASRFLKRIDKK